MGSCKNVQPCAPVILLVGMLHQVLQAVDGKLGSLACAAGAIGVFKGLCCQQVGPQLLAPQLLLWVLEELQGQLLLTQQDGVGIVDLGAHLSAELLQLLLADDACVPKPAAVWLDAGAG